MVLGWGGWSQWTQEDGAQWTLEGLEGPGFQCSSIRMDPPGCRELKNDLVLHHSSSQLHI
eukprot:1846961-Rhodomonas_salina.1